MPPKRKVNEEADTSATPCKRKCPSSPECSQPKNKRRITQGLLNVNNDPLQSENVHNTRKSCKRKSTSLEDHSQLKDKRTSTQMPLLIHNDPLETEEVDKTKRTRKRKYTSVQDRRQAKNTRRNKQLQNLNGDPLQFIATTPDILPNAPNCEFCDAKRIYLEPPTFCCSLGEIKLLETEMPSELVQLYLGHLENAKEFCNGVRSYNNMFAFTSLGVHCDKSLARRNCGIYTFRVQGQLYHFMDQLIPPTTEKPKNLQLYFFDTDHELLNRMSISSKFKETLVERLMHILQVNPYANFFRSLNSISNLNEYKIALEADPRLDQNVFNKPSTSQVAGIWLESDQRQQCVSQHIQVYPKSSQPQIIKHYFGCYDPMQYPLVFPNGESGWHRTIKRLDKRQKKKVPRPTCDDEIICDIQNCTNIDDLIQSEAQGSKTKSIQRNTVSCREYYCYKLQIREHDKSFLLHIGRLLQQYVVDMYIKIETSRLDFFRSADMQKRLRKDIYSGLLDGIAQGCELGADIGLHMMLPTSFVGGPRDMRKRYMDSIALVQRFGKPDIFLTITSNPNWPEIKALCLPSDEIQNRPDLIARIFRAKLQVLKNELFKKEIFGQIVAYAYVVEFQKRGLPHAHFLLILSQSSKMYSPEAFDKVVCAELPNQRTNPYLFSLVVKHMMHGPCGVLNPTCPCMRNGFCKSHYPKDFSENTKYATNTYPIYKRPHNNHTVTVRGSQLDNRWVIPYNPYLLAKFNCHINVEICSTIQAMKYMYKYIYKGHDKITYSLANSDDPIVDEITNFQCARWISPPEAAWRIFKFELNSVHPPVISLPIHLENEQFVTFPATQSLHNIVNTPAIQKTMLTQFFYMNRCNAYARSLNCLYVEFPEHFTWHTDSKEWKPRQQRQVIARIVSCQPSAGEKFYCKLLLMHIRGPTSFANLRTINNTTFTSNREAAQKLGLLEDDKTAEMCLQEAVAYLMPSALRHLFATVLVHCNPKNPKELWLKFEPFLSEDFTQYKTYSCDVIRQKVVDILAYYLYSMGKKLEDFFFINDDMPTNFNDNLTKELQTEREVIIPKEDLLAVQQLNVEQRAAYDQVLHHVNNNLPNIFFVDGPGGTGKTFLYKALLATVRSTGHIALATATSGVAASLLPGGRTSHSRFKIPLDENDSKSCSVSKQSTLAHLIRAAKLIIWDEATMAKRSTIEKFDEMLRDIMSSQEIFGGKTIVFGGDFRQTLPVILKGTKNDIIQASIVMSPLWNQFQKLKLTQNMRALLDPEFSSYLLKIGDGIEETNERDEIQIPSKINIPFTDDITSLNALIDVVFPNIADYNSDFSLLVKRAILTTRNDFVHEINDVLITRFPGEENTYFSCDESTDTHVMPNQQELFHSLTPSGLPPHKLTLKINAPVILLRNINPTEGLCNGTRLLCKGFDRNVIYAEISVGTHAGKPVFIPRITLEAPHDSLSSIPFKRKQFPLRLCYAMTINKAQGQTLDFVGVYLKEPVFSHGQLYVALSRAKTMDHLKVLIRPLLPSMQSNSYTKNIVYNEVLNAASTS